MKTSKIFLLLWLLLGLGLIFFQFVELKTNVLILYLAGLAVLVWNRIDSRRQAYKVTLRAPGGTSLSVSTSQESSINDGDTD